MLLKKKKAPYIWGIGVSNPQGVKGVQRGLFISKGVSFQRVSFKGVSFQRGVQIKGCLKAS